MKWEIRQVYLYLVSLVTLIMTLVGSAMLVSAMVDLVFPEPVTYCPERTEKVGQPAAPTTQECEEFKKNETARQSVFRKRQIINQSIFLVIVAPTYWYHWRQAQRFTRPQS